MAELFVAIKNIYHAVVAVFMLIPILITMGDAGNPDTPVNTYPESDNSYITEYLEPDIAAHRSGAGIAPQNTLMAFENIIENEETNKIDIVTNNGCPTNITESSSDNANGKAIKVDGITLVSGTTEDFKGDGDYPYRGLRGDDIPDNLRIVTCDEVIDYVEANSEKEYIYSIEIKSIGSNGRKAADKLYSIITERNLQNRVIWSTFAPITSSYMASNYPEISRTADAIEAVQFYFYYRMDWDLQDVSPSYTALQIPYGSSAFDNLINLGTRELLNYAHSNNVAVQYWTINSEEEVKTLTLNGADCIMTDYPQMAYDTVESCK